MFVLAEDAAEAVTSVNVRVSQAIRLGDRFGQRRERPGVRETLVWSMGVVEDLELA
jgi:hypothetical protein